MSTGKYRKDHTCLNCGFHVEKHYCSSCGQPNLELKENFWDFISHSVAHYFHFDNKFFQTLVPLLTKPGKVTLDYLAGKRSRYINPVSMYIFVSIVYFLVVYSSHKKSKDNEETKIERTISLKEQKAELDSLDYSLKSAGLIEQKAIIKSKGKLQEAIDRALFKNLSFKGQDSVLKSLKANNKIKKSDSLAKIIAKLETIYIANNDSTYSAYLVRQNQLPSAAQDNWFERMIKKRSIEIGEKSEIITTQLEHNRPKQFFLLMPLMALFILLNFRKNHIYYLDHLIFTIHGMTAFFLVNIFTQPLIKHVLGSGSFMAILVNLLVFAWICWYMFNALKVFYQRKNSAIIWRMFLILTLYGVAYQLTEMIIVNVIYYVAV